MLQLKFIRVDVTTFTQRPVIFPTYHSPGEKKRLPQKQHEDLVYYMHVIGSMQTSESNQDQS